MDFSLIDILFTGFELIIIAYFISELRSKKLSTRKQTQYKIVIFIFIAFFIYELVDGLIV